MSSALDTSTARTTTAQAPRQGRCTVAAIHRGAPFHWVGDGFRVSNFFPNHQLTAERVSPFLLMDYHPPYEYPALARGQRGVGWHPHRGFETVTLAWEGSVAHHDNAGHAGVIGPGDAQWMTAASGILHQEHHEEAFSRRGGRFHMMQLWVNLPRKDKMAPPAYQPITAAEIPVVSLADGAGTVRVVAGEHQGVRGPARTFTPITMLDARLTAGGGLSTAIPAGHNALVIVLSGSVRAEGKRAGVRELVLFANDGDGIEVIAEEDAHVLVLAGEPIPEPIVQHGPFVMNTEAEIHQAIRDLNTGRFGELP